ncbi:MAG: lycopene cyclase domain-containing protein [Bacteroidia bacterium]
MNLLQSHYTYIILIAFTISGPFLLSFDKKVAFYKEWKYFLLSMLPTSLAYIVWDIIATRTAVWQFNKAFLLGPFIGELPLEEYLFFVVVPYACLFIYACLKAYFPKINKPRWHNVYSAIVIVLCLVAQIIAPGHAYTWSTFGLLGITFVTLQAIKFTHHLSYLMAAWAVALIPMAFVNGILTGNPVLIYDNAENLGIRIGTIPLEDFFYNLLYMTWMISLYEWYKIRESRKIRQIN